MQNLLNTFRKIGELSEKNEEALFNTIKKIEVPAKTLLLHPEKVCKKIYFIEKGLARTFYYKNGKDITYWLALENDFVGAMASFFLQKPSIKMVETLEDSILWEFEYYKLEQLFSKNRELETLGRKFAYYGISLMEERFDYLHFNTAKERYEILIMEFPEIIQRTSLGIVASYLGITQETLSRIRSKI